MNEIVRKDILNILEEMLEIFHEDIDVTELKNLSNHTIHNASIFQDEDSLSIAILIYSLSKLIDRGSNIEIKKETKLLIQSLKDHNFESYRNLIKLLIKQISKSDAKLKEYVGTIIRQARIKKASKLYDHGISVGRTSELLGISQWELIDYLGKTTIPDEPYNKKITNKRINFAKKIFKIK